jgi:D-glucuronyl C5-epimerase-like protein
MLSALAALAATALFGPASAGAAPRERVLVLDAGHVRTRWEPGAAAARLPRPRGARAARAAPPHPALDRVAATRAVVRDLRRLRRAGRITPEESVQRARAWHGAMVTLATLSGRRATELSAVAANVADLARARGFTPSRLEPVFLTLERNRQWWSSSPVLPGWGVRVQFAGTSMLWESYPGQGIQLHPLANFSKLLAFLAPGPGGWAKWHARARPFLEDELLPLAVHRAGGIAWEYYFHFDGGRPPWVSSISEGTELQALTAAARRLDDPSLLDVAHRTLGILRHPPPVGVRVRAKRGVHYLIYSFAPKLRVLNAFIQSLNGLWDFGRAGDDGLARALFRRAEPEARYETPRAVTGSWSFYSPGVRSSLSYHTLLRDFLQGLCDRTGTRVFCRTAQTFTDDLGRAGL